ncbi:MAG: DNA methyltransferase [Myxococcota bacterium]
MRTKLQLTWPKKYTPPAHASASLHLPSPEQLTQTNHFFLVDNLSLLHSLTQQIPETLDLIYIDPPFNTGRTFYRKRRKASKKQEVYQDRWNGLEDFLSMLYPRLHLMLRLLSPNGTLIVHTDHRFSHYVNTLLCELFDVEAPRNQIIWSYGGRGAKATANHFPRNHDTLLVFSKGKPFYQKQYREVRHPYSSLPTHIRIDEQGNAFKTSPPGDYSAQSLKRLEQEGRIYTTRNGNIRIKYFLEIRKKYVIEHKLLGDVWNDISDMMHQPPKERYGYPTQKPKALLRRILNAFCPPQGRIADFFSGSGTTLVVAAESGRSFLGCDQQPYALKCLEQRLQTLAPPPQWRIHRHLEDPAQDSHPPPTHPINP